MTRTQTDRNGTGTPSLTNDERFLVIKRELHQQLITGMDLSAIGTMSEEELRAGGPPCGRGADAATGRTCST